MSLGLVCNLFNEVNALPGWLETHLPFFDDVRVYHSGPQGQYSDDGTIELLEKWHIPIKFGDISEGFGAVRTKTIHMSPCDYVMLLDADERFYSLHRVLTITGEQTSKAEADRILNAYTGIPPKVDELDQLGKDLRVEFGHVYNQGELLRQLLDTEKPDAVIAARRHWHDLTLKRPTQNWMIEPDWQLRIVQNKASISYGGAMHEHLSGIQNPRHGNLTYGPFFDHFHLWFKRQELKQREHDVAIYNAIHEGKKPPTWEEYYR